MDKLSLRILALVVLATLLITVAAAAGTSPWTMGLVYGTAFQQALLAASWGALAPRPLLTRLGMSLAWLALVCGAVAVPLLIGADHRRVDLTCALLFAEWFLGLLPAWAVALLLKGRLAPSAEETNKLQFDLRSLLILTALICVLAAFFRGPFSYWFARKEYVLIAIVLGAQLLVHCLVMAGVLLNRHDAVTIFLVGVLIAFSTVGQVVIVRHIDQSFGDGVQYWINGVATAWALTFAWTIRSCGSRLVIGAR